MLSARDPAASPPANTGLAPGMPGVRKGLWGVGRGTCTCSAGLISEEVGREDDKELVDEVTTASTRHVTTSSTTGALLAGPAQAHASLGLDKQDFHSSRDPPKEFSGSPTFCTPNWVQSVALPHGQGASLGSHSAMASDTMGEFTYGRREERGKVFTPQRSRAALHYRVGLSLSSTQTVLQVSPALGDTCTLFWPRAKV